MGFVQIHLHHKIQKYCSSECYNYNKIDARIKVKCLYCGENICITNKEFKRSNKHFCDRNCFSKYIVGKNNTAYNENLSEEDRENKRKISGYNKFKSDVLLRDNYRCQLSNDDKNLEVHHLNCFSDYPNERLLVENGITLSKIIHKLFHLIYGYKHNTKKQFEEFKIKYKNGEFDNIINMLIPR